MPSVFTTGSARVFGLVVMCLILERKVLSSNPSSIFVFSIPIKLRDKMVGQWLQIGYQVGREKLLHTRRSRGKISLSTWKRILLHETMREKISSWDQNLHIAVHQFLLILDWKDYKCWKWDPSRMSRGWDMTNGAKLNQQGVEGFQHASCYSQRCPLRCIRRRD